MLKVAHLFSLLNDCLLHDKLWGPSQRVVTLFSALLVGRLVVVARGLYLARHLFTLLNNCISLAYFSFRISIFKVPVFSSCPCLRVHLYVQWFYILSLSFFCIREEIPVIFVHQLTYLLHRLFKYTGWFSLGRAIGNVNQNWSNKIWPIEKAMHLLRTFDAQAQRQLILFKSLFTTTSTQKKKKH